MILRPLLRTLLLAAILFGSTLLAREARALDPLKAPSQYVVHHWQQSEDGLPENYAPAILQTRDGYLWLTSQEGLTRFDGVRFVVLTTREVPALGMNDVGPLCEDKDGALWIGTRGTGLVRYADGKFRAFTHADGLPGDNVTFLHETRDGSLLVGTADGVAQREGDHFTPMPALKAAVLAEQADGTLWAAGRKSLSRFAAGELTKVKDGLSRVEALLADPDGTMWIGSAHGLDRFRDGVTTSLGQDIGGVLALLRDRNGNLWVGSDEGLWRLASAPHAAGTPTPLGTLAKLEGAEAEHFNVVSLAEDREGNLWVGGQNGSGVLELLDGKVTTFGSSFIWSTFIDRSGKLWLGGGPGLFTVDGDKLEPVPGGMSLNVDRFAERGDGGLWLGTRDRGLVSFQNGVATRWTGDAAFSTGDIRALRTDRHGTLWVGTNYGLARIDGAFALGATRSTPDAGAFALGATRSTPEDGHVTHFGPNDGVPNAAVRVILEVGDGSLWIGTAEGLVHLVDGKFTHLTTKDGLSNDFVMSLYSDHDDLWIGTYGGGLDLLRGGKLGSVTTKNGLFNDEVFSIVDDGDDVNGSSSLWMSCNQGIFHAKKSELAEVATGARLTLESPFLGKSDGMRSSECNAGGPAAMRAPDGKLWFATTVGAARIDPQHLPKNMVVPPVLVEEMRVDRAPVDLRTLRELPAGSRDFEITYTALSFTAPERVRFKYKLEGFDRDWVDADVRRVAFYTNLAPGSYRFRVIAANDDGVWNESGASVSFRLKPHFYQTVPFYLLCALALAFMGSGFVGLRLRALRQKAAELEAKVEERTVELASASAKLKGAFRALATKDERLQEDLLQAKAFQERMLPKLPSGGAIRFRAVYRPADLVGGDVYDVCEVAEGHYRIFIADTTGHGVQASLRTMVLKTEYDRVKLAREGPARVLMDLNRKLSTLYPDLSMRCSACCFDVIADDDGATLRYANAAHPPLLRVSGGQVDEIYGSGTFLGIQADAPFGEKEERLGPEDVIVAYTDGICEQEDEGGQAFGVERMAELLAGGGRDTEETVRDLDAALTAFSGKRSLEDDVVILAVACAGARRSIVAKSGAPLGGPS
ncbi:MAG: two-component regulator propeller domain-containing protein [Polyangiaceae bacterium]